MLPSTNDKAGAGPKSARDNPYAPPGLEGASATSTSTSCVSYARIAAVGAVLAAFFGAFLGMVQTVQYGIGLQRFGGLEYVPRVVVLSTVRSLGPAAALLVTAMSAVIVLHRAGRRATRSAQGLPRAPRDRRTLWLAATTVASFLLVCGFVVLAGSATASVFYGVSVSVFFDAGRSSLLREDVRHGAIVAAIHAGVATAIIPLVAPWLVSPRRGFVLKLFVAYAAVQGTSLLEQAVLALHKG